MLKKNEKKLEKYMKAGAELRLTLTLLGKLRFDISGLLCEEDQKMLIAAMNKVGEVALRTEEKMYRDFPNLSSHYLEVFCGDVGAEPMNEVDEKIIAMAREAADEVFKRE